MAIKRESVELKDDFVKPDDDLIQQIKREAFEAAVKAVKEENERLQKLKEEEDSRKTLWGYSITLSYMHYNAVHKVAEFLIVNDIQNEFFEVPEGVPTEVSLAVIEILDEHIRKNSNNPEAIMYRYVKNNKVFK